MDARLGSVEPDGRSPSCRSSSARRRWRRRPGSTSCSSSTRRRARCTIRTASARGRRRSRRPRAQWGIHDFTVWNEPNTRLYWTPQKGSQRTGRRRAGVRGAAREVLRLDPRRRPARARDRHGPLAARLDERVDRAARLPPRRRQGVSRLRPDDADHGPALGAPVPEPERPDEPAGRRLSEPGPLRHPGHEPRQAGGLGRVQRHRPADDAERAHLPDRRGRLADRHRRSCRSTSTRRTSGW